MLECHYLPMLLSRAYGDQDDCFLPPPPTHPQPPHKQRILPCKVSRGERESRKAKNERKKERKNKRRKRKKENDIMTQQQSPTA